MDPVKAVVTPAKQGDWERRGRVQVTVSVSGRPYTCHAHRENKSGRWFTNNPDRAAIARLDAAEAVERRAKDISLGNAETELKLVNAAVSVLKGQKTGMKEKEYAKARRFLGLQSKEAEAKLSEAKALAEAAKKAVDELRAVTPRILEVVHMV